MPIPSEDIQQTNPDLETDPNANVDDSPDDQGTRVTTAEDGSVQVETRQTRRDKRNGRFVSQLTQERDQFRGELEAARRELAEMRGLLQGQAQQRQAPVQQQQQPDNPHDRELATIRREMETIQHALRTGVDEATGETLKKRFYELDDRRDAVLEERAAEKAYNRLQQQQQQQSGDVESQMLRAEFPDVIREPKAMKWAHGQYLSAIADGEPDTLETSRKYLLKAAEKFGIRRPTMPRPSEAVQQRFGGIPSQAGARSMGDAVKLSREEQKMAIARWPELSDEQAFANMAKLIRTAQANGE